MISQDQCPICQGDTFILDVVDFAIQYPEFWTPGKPVTAADWQLSGKPVYYHQCRQCAFSYAPEIANWSEEEFSEKIYNENFTKVDVDAVDKRPRNNAGALIKMFGQHSALIRHLDYGGGTGLLSNILRDEGWDSRTYEPYLEKGTPLHELGKFNLITAFEVFEHVPDPLKLMETLGGLLEESGLIMLTTMLADEHLVPGRRISWWYVTPSTGHISLFSRKSLQALGRQAGLSFGSFNSGFHCFFTTPPEWARFLFKKVG